MDPLDSSETADGGSDKAEIPSCLGCRRRKLKCSRERPMCSHCARLESTCVYELNKNKPGVKAGVVGSLSLRVEALEHALLNRPHEDSCCHRGQPEQATRASSSSLGVVEVLSMLTTELQRLTSKPPAAAQLRSIDGLRDNTTASPTASLSSSRYSNDNHDRTSHMGTKPRKRRRVDSCGNPNIELSLPLEEHLDDITSSLPPPALLEDVINVYFDIIQPWIPILHETQFRSRIHDQEHFPKLLVVFHAILVAAIRFVDNPEAQLNAAEIERCTVRSRRFVLLTAMETLSVENLQALVIIAWTDIGGGDTSKAWSIIGSLTRTVEYLQLSVESDHQSEEPLLKPLPIISGPKDWTQEEERRRVFWNIFCLDRFCSVTTGWNTSLTSDDVRRRLPADGGLWHKGEFVTTPYFGIWDKSVAKIGNSIAFLPGNYPSPDASQDAPSAAPLRSGAQKGPNDLDMTTIGAFAYCVEATESLSRITTYFLQQKIDFKNKKQVTDWLTRFKELDLRLVHWKMFLPQRWRDSNISRQPDLINMDPNLTLAHVTHNTSMILLHQRIAYPDERWSGLKLPSFCSAEACQVAAVETTSITQKYLKHTAEYSPVANQYAFCVFISARVLLVHWRHYKADLALEFWILVQALDEMAKRWAGPVLRHFASRSLAGTYAEQLRSLHSQCEINPQFEIDLLGYAGNMVQGLPSSPGFQRGTGSLGDSNKAFTPGSRPSFNHYQEHMLAPGEQGPSHGRTEPDVSNMGSAMDQPGLTPGADFHQDRLSAISHMLMDENFMAMDRVITLDDMIFASAENGGSGMTWTSNGDGTMG